MWRLLLGNIHRIDHFFDIYLDQRDMRSMLNAVRCLKQHAFSLEWKIGAWLLNGGWQHLTWQHVWYTAFVHSVLQRRVPMPTLLYVHPTCRPVLEVVSIIQQLLKSPSVRIRSGFELSRFDLFLIGSYFQQNSVSITLFEPVVTLRYPWMHGFCETYAQMGWLEGLHAIEAHVSESTQWSANVYSIEGVIETETG